MGRPRVNRALPPYASAFIDNRGKERIRLRRTGWPTIYIQDKPGTPEFTEAYNAWLQSGKVKAGEGRIIPGSFDDLITRFYRSADWRDLKAKTQYTYRGELERFRAKYGERPVAQMQVRHIAKLMELMHETPTAANNLKKRLGQLFDFAARLGWRKDNPARLVRSLKVKSGGYRTWQEEQIEQFEAFWPVGTMQRLAFDLALYTAQRRSDVRVMGPQHIKDGAIRVLQLKTGKTLWIPIHPKLAESIAATPSGNLAFLVRPNGTPFTEKGFGMWFMRQCRAAGLEGYSMHGLRKGCSRRMAEAGLSNQQIKSITGHSGDAEVARYTREAQQAKMAKDAMDIMASESNSGLAGSKQGIANVD